MPVQLRAGILVTAYQFYQNPMEVNKSELKYFIKFVHFPKVKFSVAN